MTTDTLLRKELCKYRVILWAYLIPLPFMFAFLYWACGALTPPAHLFGDKTTSPFDLWSFQHFLNGIIFAWIYMNLREAPNKLDCLWTVLFINFAWEGHEAWAETGMRGALIAGWTGGVEHWTNRVIADPLLVLCGALLFFAYPKIAKPALALTTCWICANLALPDCMTLQTLLLTHWPF